MVRAWIVHGVCALLIGLPPAAADPLPTPATGWPEHDPALVSLGRDLFYDPILSGSRTVSCASCHHPDQGTSDGLSLGLGDGAHGLGPGRAVDPENVPEQRVPRNSPGLWNLGHPSFTVMFWDGRLEALPDGTIRTPLGEDMVEGFASVLSAQTMFPVLSPDEMAGHYGESEISRLVRLGMLSHEGGAWDALSARLEAIPAYRTAFDASFGTGPIRFTQVSDALAAFIATEWRADDAPFDRHLRGEAPLEGAALRGMELFYGEAGCATCHAGPFQTDNAFHAIAMPQIGPGKAARFEDHARDEGRARVTGADPYAFRTPSLRNVALTAPYGHAGAYATLEGVVRHHLDPVTSLMAYDAAQAVLPALAVEDGRVPADPGELARIAAANVLEPAPLPEADVAALIAFLHALTDPAERLGVPETVPSGRPVDR